MVSPLGRWHAESIRIALIILSSFILQLKGLIERIDGNALRDYLSFVVKLKAGVLYGAKEMGMRNDRMVVMFLLHLRYSYDLFC